MTDSPRPDFPKEPEDGRALRAGDSAAFDRLYDRYAPRVLGYLLRLNGGRRAEAEDLTQETFLAAFQGRVGFGGRSQPLAWLLGIARRRWRDGLRATDPIRHASAWNETETPIASSDHADRVATATTLEAALNHLPPAEREALLLTAVQGLTYAEAARILEEPVGTVKWRVHEATKRLRRLLNAAENQDEVNTLSPTPARETGHPQRTADTSCRG